MAIFFKKIFCGYSEIVHCNVVCESRIHMGSQLAQHTKLFLYTFCQCFIKVSAVKQYSFAHNDSLCDTYCSGIGAISYSTFQQFLHLLKNVHQ